MKHVRRKRSAAEQAALRATLDRLEWKAWNLILWGCQGTGRFTKLVDGNLYEVVPGVG